jgi:hypothetical protein
MKDAKSLVLAIVIVPLISIASAAPSVRAGQEQGSKVLVQAETAPQSAEPQSHRHGMMGGRGMGQGMMGGPGMMAGPGGMMEMPMMEMMNDPKTRGQMMEIQGRMMKDMGDLMEKRGQELQQGK